VGERDLAGARDHASADQPGVGDGVVRRAKGRCATRRGRRRALPATEWILWLQRLLKTQGAREDGRRLPAWSCRAGRPIMRMLCPPAGCDLQARRFGHLLAAHVLEVVGKCCSSVEQAGGLDAQRAWL